MAVSKLFLVVLACIAVAACAAGVKDTEISTRKLLTKSCGGHYAKPDCCVHWDWLDCYCRRYKDGYDYINGKCKRHSNDDDDDDDDDDGGDYGYECPHCCKDCDYYAERCKAWKADWVYKGGKCEYKPHYECPECCGDCDYEHGDCKWYKPGYYYKDGKCHKKYEEKWDCPECCEWCDYRSKRCREYKSGWYYEGGRCAYRGRSTAEASANADCYGLGCTTKTHAQTLTTSRSSHSSSYATSSTGK